MLHVFLFGDIPWFDDVTSPSLTVANKLSVFRKALPSCAISFYRLIISYKKMDKRKRNMSQLRVIDCCTRKTVKEFNEYAVFKVLLQCEDKTRRCRPDKRDCFHKAKTRMGKCL